MEQIQEAQRYFGGNFANRGRGWEGRGKLKCCISAESKERQTQSAQSERLPASKTGAVTDGFPFLVKKESPRPQLRKLKGRSQRRQNSKRSGTPTFRNQGSQEPQEALGLNSSSDSPKSQKKRISYAVNDVPERRSVQWEGEDIRKGILKSRRKAN